MRLLIENLHEYKQNLESEIKQNRQDFSGLEKDFQELKTDLSSATAKNDLLSEDNKKKDLEIQILMDKIDNIETNFTIQAQEIKLSYESAMQYLNAEIELHKKSLVMARSTIEDCHKSYIEMKDNKKLVPINESLENQVRNLEVQLTETHGIIKEKAREIEKSRIEYEILFKENQELKKRALLTEENEQNLENLQSELAQYKLLVSENELLKNKAEDTNEKYQRLLNDFENMGARSQEHTETLKKAVSKNVESQEKLNDIIRTNAQLTQINQENGSRNEEFRLQNERLKEEVSELLRANEKLNKKIEDLAYEHQTCFDTQRLEKEKIYQEFELKQRKVSQEMEFKRKELENQMKTLELQFSSERDVFLREKKGLKQSFEVELEQLNEFNNSLKATLYEHENQINSLKAENEALFNEKQRVIADCEAQMMDLGRNTHNYRAALSDLENTCNFMNRENQEINMELIREKEPLRRYNENYMRFNGSKAIRASPIPMGGLIEFDRARIGRTGGSFDRKTMDILKNNERLNEQILRRCREIVGE